MARGCAGRSGLEECVRDVGRFGAAEARPLDLSSLADVTRFARSLAEDGVKLDVAVLNAGVVPSGARRTRDGLDEMFQVNFLSNVLLARRLIREGVMQARPSRAPRFVMVSSESHRSARPIDFTGFGVYRDYGMGEVVKEYGYGKLLLECFTAELARRLKSGDTMIAAHSCCPGAVRTGIAREAPRWAQPLLVPVMQVFFRPPDEAMAPVIYLSTARALEGETGRYVHVRREKRASDEALDPGNGARLWDASEALLTRLGHAP